MNRRRWALAAAAALNLGLSLNCTDTATFPDTGPPPAEASVGPDSAPATCPGVPCEAEMICHRGECIVDWGACQRDETCFGDTFCVVADGRCLPYADDESSGTGRTHDPECKEGSFSPDRFEQPVVRCQYTKAAALTTPLVIDLDGDDQPEILFVSYAVGAVGGWLIALSGSDCTKEVFQIDANLSSRSQLAVGQLSDDPGPEIVGIDKLNRVVVFDHQGGLIAVAPEAAHPGASPFNDGGPAIADLDGKSPPEIIYGGMALRLEGAELKVLYNHPVEGGHWGTLSAVADVDLDGVPEVVVGNRIFDGPTGIDETPTAVAGWPGGYPAIVQWDATPEPEVVLVSSQAQTPATIRIFNPKTGQLVFGPITFGQNFGGPPTVADFDGDGEPEVGVAGTVGYQVFDRECVADPLPPFCHSFGVRWLKPTRDRSSGSTGSSVFDFNGDGEAEVIYRDECWLRVYDGHTGKVRFARQVTSGTILELPVVADVDDDGHADLVVSSHELTDTCDSEPELGLAASASGTRGILVLSDPHNRWAPSRTIWNQHTYHITNIDADGAIPAPEKNSWERHNSYRQNIQGEAPEPSPAPDLTGGQAPALEPESCAERWPLSARICNRGASDAPAGIVGTFYRSDPRQPGAKKICSATTTKALSPGQCEAIRCDWPAPPEGSVDLWFVADDDGQGGEGGHGAVIECREQNNLLYLPRAACKPLK